VLPSKVVDLVSLTQSYPLAVPFASGFSESRRGILAA
jgi:hypothetical protein